MKTTQFYEFLGYASLVATCIPACITLLPGKKAPRALFSVFIYVWIAAVFDIACLWLSQYNVNNMVLIHSFTIIEFCTLIFIYFHVFEHRAVKPLIPFLCIMFSVFAIMYMCLAKDAMLRMNSIPRSVEAIIMIIFSVAYFFKLFRDLQVDNLMRLPMFWLNTAVLVYFSGNFFLFTFSDYLMGHDMEHFHEFWAMHSCFNICFNVFLGLGIWQIRRT